MNLSQLHKKLAMKAMDRNNPLAETIAQTIGFNVDGKFESFYDRILQINTNQPETYEKNKRNTRKNRTNTSKG